MVYYTNLGQSLNTISSYISSGKFDTYAVIRQFLLPSFFPTTFPTMYTLGEIGKLYGTFIINALYISLDVRGPTC